MLRTDVSALAVAFTSCRPRHDDGRVQPVLPQPLESSFSYTPATPQLVTAARNGEAGALEALLVASRHQVLRFAERHCIVHDVEDAVQETLIQASRHIGQLRVVDAFCGWLFRITKRECDRLKRAWRLHIHDYAPDEPLPELVTRPVEELRCDLVAGLQSLPPHYREILLLRDAEELTIEEISQQLGLTRLAVKARLHRARVLLREYLQP